MKRLLWLFILIGIMTPASLLFGAEIDLLLQDKMDEISMNDMIPVIIYMRDQADIQSLNQQLKTENSTLAERNKRVILALQDMATATQKPVIEQLEQLKSNGDIENYKIFWIANMFQMTATKNGIESLVQDNYIDILYLDEEIENIVPVAKVSADGLLTGHEIGLDRINAPAVWAQGWTGAGRVIMNIDTGVDGNHPALADRFRGDVDGDGDVDESWFDPYTSWTFPQDGGSHGTHTMGTICGRTPSGDTIGVAIDAQWIAAAPIDRSSIPQTVTDALLSFQWAVDPDGNPNTPDFPDAIGNSWGVTTSHGYPPCDQTFWSVIDNCEAAGSAVIFSAGNEGPSSYSHRRPGDRGTTNYNCFSVGAVDGASPSLPIASFSSRGPSDCGPNGETVIKPEVVAPGVQVRSSVPGGGYASWNGTSMASPHVTGSIAILRQVNPNLDVDTIKDILMQTASDLGGSGEDNTYGHGIFDIEAAVGMAMSGFGFIEGYVTESGTGDPLAATIEIIGRNVFINADPTGYYSIGLQADTTYNLEATLFGYLSSQASVAVVANDTTTQNFQLVLGPQPILDYSPAFYAVSSLAGGVETRNLNIINNGPGPLYYSLNTEVFDELGAVSKNRLPNRVSNNQLPLGERIADPEKQSFKYEPYYPPVITSQGGPDAFGHTWIDSDETGGPTFNWVDISGIGTPLSFGDDENSGPYSLGFSVPFFENEYTSIRICSNGFLSFTSSDDSYINDNIPNSSAPNNMIAPFWDDINPSNGGNIYFYTNNSDSAIVQYSGVPHYPSSGSYTFQAILLSNGKIVFQYLSMTGELASNTVGIENISGNDGLQVAYNQTYIHNNMAILFKTGEWLSSDTDSGIIPPGSSETALITFDATDLIDGVYTGNIDLDSNDPTNPIVDIAVTFIVGETGTAQILQTPSSITETLESGESSTAILKAYNMGDGVLTLAFSETASWLSLGYGPYDIDPGDSLVQNVNFDATGLLGGTYNTSITTTTNDPVSPTINMPITLNVTAADIEVATLYIEETIVEGSQSVIYLPISNSGQANLTIDLTAVEIQLLDNSNEDSAIENRILNTWLFITPDNATVEPSGVLQAEVSFNAVTLTPGYYEGNISLLSNDPVDPAITVSVLLEVIINSGNCDYTAGDVNGNGSFNGLDVTYGVSYFKGGSEPVYSCECTPGEIWFVAGDVNNSCTYNGLDITYSVSYFKGGPDPMPCAACPPSPVSAKAVNSEVN